MISMELRLLLVILQGPFKWIQLIARSLDTECSVGFSLQHFTNCWGEKSCPHFSSVFYAACCSSHKWAQRFITWSAFLTCCFDETLFDQLRTGSSKQERSSRHVDHVYNASVAPGPYLNVCMMRKSGSGLLTTTPRWTLQCCSIFEHLARKWL